MEVLLENLSTILFFIWNYTFTACSNFLVNNGFGMLIVGMLITGIIIDALIEIFHIN